MQVARELNQLFQFASRRTRVDGIGSERDGSFQIGRSLANQQCGGGVHDDDIASRPRFSGENGTNDIGIRLPGSPPFRSSTEAGGHGEIGGRPAAFLHAAIFDLKDGGGTGGCDFIETIGAVDDESPLDAEADGSLREHLGGADGKRADQLEAGAHRIGQRAEKVEDCVAFQQQARFLRVLHGGMEQGRVEKTNTDLANAAGDLIARKDSRARPRLRERQRCRIGSKCGGFHVWRRAAPHRRRRTPWQSTR